MSAHELPLDRLATTDEKGRRVYLYPADVRGFFRRWRSVLSALLLVFFLVLPWIRIGGRPAILLDLPGRKFSVLGFMFWAHDAPMLLFVAGGAILSLALVTALWGRIWCGWACPQTVFVDSVYRRIERWIEGDSVERKRLDQGPWNADKAMKKGVKWAAFSLVSLVIGHSFLAYFTGTEVLAAMMHSSPAQNPSSFLVMAGVSGLVLFDFGWFREQFCTVICPYGRFQSVLMDERSLVVSYDVARGEPRRGKAMLGIPQGDCINCYKCVAVCPTGIDIRRGLQLECIACTACIDVCDAVMEKVGKPAGLIRYTNVSGGRAEGFSLRPRVLANFALLALLMAGLVATLTSRRELSVDFVRVPGAPYEEIRVANLEARIINHFRAELRNQGFDPIRTHLTLSEPAREQGAEIVIAAQPPMIEGGGAYRADFFIRFPKTMLSMGRGLVPIHVSSDNGEKIETEVKLVGPLK